MKIEIFFVHIILLLITTQELSSQNNSCCSYDNNIIYEPALPGELFLPGFSVDATTYFNNEWLAGDIYLSNGEIVKDKLLKYNGLLDVLLWKESKSNSIIKLDKEAVESFHFLNFKGDSTIYFRRIKIKRDIITDSTEYFGQIIYDEIISIFVIHTFNLTGTELVRINGIPYQKDIYNEVPYYCFRFANNKIFVTKSLNKQSLYSFSPLNKNIIKDYLKEDRIGKLIENSKLIRLAQFLSTLENQQ
ncbi:MAG TPA: hypothetical protein VMV77_13065 [Bacteroidales bacterium]|nr:hypothetical protein [Bacteroidales bacterium]